MINILLLINRIQSFVESVRKSKSIDTGQSKVAAAYFECPQVSFAPKMQVQF